MTADPFVLDLDTLSTLRPLRHVVYSLGSNLGDSLEYLQRAVDALARTPDTIVTAVSSVYLTDPVGKTDQPPFHNIVVLAESTLPSAVLLDRAQAIENGLGRVRDERWGPRTIDVDLIAVGDREMETRDLTLPHPRAHERAFVLVPWAEVEPDAVLPGRGPVARLVERVGTAGVRRLDGAGVTLP